MNKLECRNLNNNIVCILVMLKTNITGRKRIGVVTWVGTGNYGTSLQAYALCRFLTKKGYQCELINEFDYKHFSVKSYVKSFLRKTRLLNLKEIYNIRKQPNAIKYFKLRKFLRINIKQRYVETPWQYRSLMRKFDQFCVGSDQIWNAYNQYSPFFFLDFAQSKKRISYASSMGTKDFPEEYRGEIKDFLLKFDHISLREDAGNKVVSELTGRKDVKTVLDPTFLLVPDEWKEVAKKAEIEIELPQKYIIVYLIGDNKNYTQQVNDLKAKTGIVNLVVIPALENPSMKMDGAIIYRYAAVSEFIYLLSNASWICTDSFHATAISINLQKDFTELLRFKDSDKTSQNSRIYDILNTYGLQDRLYNSNTDSWAKPIDYTKATATLEELREDSSKWLINAIEN